MDGSSASVGLMSESVTIREALRQYGPMAARAQPRAGVAVDHSMRIRGQRADPPRPSTAHRRKVHESLNRKAHPSGSLQVITVMATAMRTATSAATDTATDTDTDTDTCVDGTRPTGTPPQRRHRPTARNHP